MRYKVIQFYYDESIYPQHAIMDTKRKDTIRDQMGYTSIMTKSTARWVCDSLNRQEKNNVNNKNSQTKKTDVEINYAKTRTSLAIKSS